MNNKLYGKLDGDLLQYAPRNAEYEGTYYCPAPENVLRNLGFKNVILKPYPDDGHEYEQKWEEASGTIKQKWVRLPDPPQPDPPTPPEQREIAYSTEPICRYGNGIYTVDYMNKLWYEYSAEGETEKTTEIQEIIAAAKAEIRERYPD